MGFTEELAGLLVNAGVSNYPPSGGLIRGEYKDLKKADGSDQELLVIRETGSSDQMSVQETVGIKYVEQTAQILTRATTYPVARSLIYAAYDVFRVVRNQLIQGTFYMGIDPVQSPFQIARDENDRWFFAFNLRAKKRIS